ncbi:helicase-related protein [Kineococcus sp. NUM-3379]
MRDEQRPASAEEQQILSRWSSWGAVPAVFDEDRPEWAAARAELRELVGEDGYTAARRTTINAHFTDPAIVKLMWTALKNLGFEEGRVLEPGCGSGTFLGLAPEMAELTGVELDPSSAAIAAALYPQANVRAESFAATHLPAGHFDAAIGNVPFADVTLHDPQYNRGGHSLHNHFILKSLHLVRPGGMVAVLTSRYTLDAGNPSARREMNELADLVGAVRLPTGAHRRTAGTEAVTDLLILRRREEGVEPRSTLWETVTPRRVGDEVVRINNYFEEHPEHILGELEVGHGMHNSATLHVRLPLEQLHDRLAYSLGIISRDVAWDELKMTPRSAVVAREAPARVAEVGEGHWDGHIDVDDRTGDFTILQTGVHEPMEVPRSQAPELRALLGLRDAARTLLTAEAETLDDSEDLERLRSGLRRDYDAYVARYGPINRFTLRSTGRVDPDTGEPRTARVAPRVMATFRRDPFAPLVFALENFDEASQSATPATIMSQRVVVPRAPRLGADTPEDALAITLDTLGRVELAEVARLLGVDEDEARQQLGTLVYEDPETNRLVPRAEYLSGNVRTKLDAAEAAAEQDPRWMGNVEALREVLPAPLGADDIEARLGAVWVSAEDHQEFVRELLDDPRALVEHPGGAIWGVRAASHSLKATSEWGTQRMPAGAIIQATLEQRPVQVTDEVEGKRYLNPDATAAAQEKAQAIQERFAEWVWEDPDRARRLVDNYNRTFNSLVLRDYTVEGERLTLPGLSMTLTPRPHQRTAVARMLSEPAVGLFHEVGAGKTLEMVMGAMELRRLGMARKPALVIPNHMLEQFSREWLQAYPQARLLAASSEDLAGDKRRQFVARVATGDWDAVILTRTAFQRLPVSPQAEADYMQQETAQIRAMLERSEGGDRLTVKRLEKMVAAAEQRLEARLDSPDDPGITFEATGIDYLIIDEAHEYKNLMTVSNIRDAAIAGSQRASDLHMKLELLRRTHGDRVVTAATATPIANSITEAHVMCRYLRPDLLEAAGVDAFDSWAATFGQTVTEIELAPTGGGSYRQQTRFAKFQNVPEMLRMWHVFADVKTAEDLKLPTPELTVRADGQRQPRTVALEPSDALRDYVQDLGRRAELVRSRAVEPDVDNMLKISTDGRKAALDMRMVDPTMPVGATKLSAAADTIADIWAQHRETLYRDGSGELSPRPGALQIVFCDLGTPTGAGWSAYDELRKQLVKRGMPAEQVRFIHEAKNDSEKGRLFAACRSGEVAVIVGSTQKMGVGTNIQARAVALHHLDCPWRPADLQQRDGRILRQGNQNPEISIYRWVTEGSFDAYSWQTVERKARFIAQVMRGRLDVREMDDVGDNALSFAEVKALASGDPLVMEKASADAELTKFERLLRAHGRNEAALRRTITIAEDVVHAAGPDLPRLLAAETARTSTTGDAFQVELLGKHYDSRTDAAAALRTWVKEHEVDIISRGRWQRYELGEVASLGGHVITAAAVPWMGREGRCQFQLRGVPRIGTTVDMDGLLAEGIGTVRRLENLVQEIPAAITRVEHERDRALADIDQARLALSRPFKYDEQLTAARQRVADIAAQMSPDKAPAPGPDAVEAPEDATAPAVVSPPEHAEVETSIERPAPEPAAWGSVTAAHHAARQATAPPTHPRSPALGPAPGSGRAM